jgi:hypothetical protein
MAEFFKSSSLTILAAFSWMISNQDLFFELSPSEKASFFLQRTSTGRRFKPSKAFLSHHFSIPLY